MGCVGAPRTDEGGLRVALGGRRRDVLRMVMGRGLEGIVIGLVIGISSSLALTRLIAGFLFGVANTDPMTYSIVAVVPTAVAMVGCYIPPYPAAQVGPHTALRDRNTLVHLGIRPREGILGET